jgi:ABC-2 type transport system permease protein
VLTLLVGFAVGVLPLRTASPRALMVVWDGLIAGFVFFWLIGLASELQRSDVLSFDRFLHLPVSPTGAFLINYLGSSLTLSVALFLPAMTGLSLGLVVSRGPRMLLLLPMVAALFLMVTAVTYLFRGWLASMMQNPRRRRAIIAAVPILFVLAAQLPNVLNRMRPDADVSREGSAKAPPARNADDAYETTRLANMVLPPGWLAYGAEAAAQGRVWPALAGTLGMGLIAGLSLTRAYRTTIRLYRGDFRKGRRSPIPLASPVQAARTGGFGALSRWRIPWTSERVSAVAVAGFRSCLRAPEMKMTLLTPVIMLVVFTGMFAGQDATAHELVRPLSTSALAGFMLIMGMMGPVGNQFGYDRAGFRAFVLSPAPRRDVLLGKNLAVVPFAFGTMAAVVGLAQWFNPMRVDHLAAVLLQLVPLYLMFCLAGNLMSIVGPMALKPGSGMPARHQGWRTLLPLAFMLVLPLPLGLTLIPLGVEALLTWMGRSSGFPAYLVLNVVQVFVVGWLYRFALDAGGILLQRREQRILEIVGSPAE